jgi:hypothetical protein
VKLPRLRTAQDAFDMLNDMIDQWSNEQMMVFYKTEIIFTLLLAKPNIRLAQVGKSAAQLPAQLAVQP